MYRIIGADQKEYGPISPEQLRQWITEGRVNARTLVLPEGSADWKPIGSFPEFSMLLGIPAAAPPCSIPLNQPQPLAPLRTNPMALAGMIMGLISITFGLCCCCYGFPFNLLGIVFSLIGLSQIKSNPDLYSGRGMATTGLITSLVSLVLGVLLIIIGFAFGWWGEMMGDLKNL